MVAKDRSARGLTQQKGTVSRSGGPESKLKVWAVLVPSEAVRADRLQASVLGQWTAVFTSSSLYACLCVQMSPLQGQQSYWIKVTLMTSFYFDYLCKDLMSK